MRLSDAYIPFLANVSRMTGRKVKRMVRRPRSRPDCAPNLGLGRRQGGETQLGSHPPPHLLDGLVYLRHTAGAMDERVLAFRDGMQADIDAGVFRSLRERAGLAQQHFRLRP